MTDLKGELRKIVKPGCMLIGIAMIFQQCLDPYLPTTTHVNYSYLVVDGFLNTDGDTIKFGLSRTQPLSAPDVPAPEPNGTIIVEEEGGASFAFTGDGRGGYWLPPGLLDFSRRHRMHIYEQSGNEYQSEFVESLTSPAIDSVYWTPFTQSGTEGININLDTHDPTGTAKYLMWNYVETWEYTSAFNSDLVIDPVSGELVYRTQDISHCWDSLRSSVILTASTSGLAEDRISAYPLTFISKFSPKISFKYTTIVHQYSITPEAYTYWQTIKKNTENVGTVFGPLPSQANGNYTCVSDPTIPMLGFLSAGVPSNLRFFVNTQVFPRVNQYETAYVNCQSYMAGPSQATTPTTDLFLYPLFSGITLIGYQMTSAFCADCRLNGGTIKPPAYW